MKAAMRAKDKLRLGTIRLMLAAIKQREIDDRIELDDQQVLSILDKLAKQRRESIQQFQQASRDDLVAQEQFELEVILAYLPEQLPEAELDNLIKQAIEQTEANSMKDMGKVMGILRPQVQGRADMSLVSSKIKALLG